VLGVDYDDVYLRQARFAAEVSGFRHRVPQPVGVRRGPAGERSTS
jgi:hypothetical protein